MSAYRVMCLFRTAILLLFFVLCFVVGSLIDDHSAESASAAAAIQEQKEAFRIARASVEICGVNASWTLTDRPGEILCVTKHGRRSITAQVTK